MDPDNLWDRVKRLTARQRPIIACVSVAGSTEEVRSIGSTGFSMCATALKQNWA